MIKEDYVSFETAKLLKEKGFDVKGVKVWYDGSGEMYYDRREIKYQIKIENHEKFFQCPTLQMAMKWLREVHKINIEVCLGFDADSELGFFYNPVISDLKNMGLGIETPEFDETEFTVYEEAAEAAILYCLKNLI